MIIEFKSKYQSPIYLNRLNYSNLLGYLLSQQFLVSVIRNLIISKMW